MKKRKKPTPPRRRRARRRRDRTVRARAGRTAAPRSSAPVRAAALAPPPAPPSTTAPAFAAPIAPPLPAPTQVEARGRPVVTALARIARAAEPPRVRLERAVRQLLGAYGESDPEFSALFLTGWAQARRDKQFRLTLAWQREQIRLSLEEILIDGVKTGAFRAGLDPGAIAAVIVGTAEGCLLQAVTEGGSVPADRLAATLLGLAVSGA